MKDLPCFWVRCIVQYQLTLDVSHMIQMYYNQVAAIGQGSDIFCTTAKCKYN